jgi:hypothetical protein
MNFIPEKVFRKKIFIYRENELVIETATNLALSGAMIKKIICNKKSETERSKHLLLIKGKISSIVDHRIKEWVIPEIKARCKEIFYEDLEKILYLFYENRAKWREEIKKIGKENGVLLTNHPSGVEGYAITSLCRENKVPVITAQHGVTLEISKYYDEIEYASDPNTSDCYLAYNDKAKDIALSSNFSIGKVFVSGISLRHLRMSSKVKFINKKPPLVYVSTNLYRGNTGPIVSHITDCDRSIKEKDLIIKVFSKLPHSIRYKSYPEENRRYPDIDPVFSTVDNFQNVKLFDEKSDMRYIYRDHQVIITSRATSTLGWAIMSKKPVVFINWKGNNPLTEEAETLFEKSLFLFNDDEYDFHEKLRGFLSKSISEIEELWMSKYNERKYMINYMFSKYNCNAGKRSAKMILNHYFN